MEKYFTKPTKGFHFSENGLKTVQDHYGGTYVGYFCTKRPDGSWNDTPVDVFYQPNPDITNAISVTEQPMLGVIANDGEVVVSRYRHDYRRSNDGSVFIDGGRDYTKYGWADSSGNAGGVLPRLTQVKIVEDKLVAE
jgi:hypothetical protein